MKQIGVPEDKMRLVAEKLSAILNVKRKADDKFEVSDQIVSNVIRHEESLSNLEKDGE